MTYLFQKFMLGLLEMAIVWLFYAIFIKYIIQNIIKQMYLTLK